MNASPLDVKSEESDWESYIESHPESTVYHSLLWKKVSEKSFGHQTKYLKCKSAGKIDAVLPLFFVRGLRSRKLVSLPLRDRGGPLCSSDAALFELLHEAVDLAHRLRCDFIEIKNPAVSMQRALAHFGFQRENYWVDSVLDLTSVGDLREGMKKTSTKWSISKAIKRGLTVELSEKSEDFSVFEKLFAQRRKQLGIPPFPASLFHNIRTFLIPEKKVRLFVCKKENQIVGGLIVFTHHSDMISGYLGFDKQFSRLRLNDLLFWRSIEWGLQEGFQRFFFGADSPLQKSLLAYKRKWGAVQATIPYFYYECGSKYHEPSDSSLRKYEWIRAVFRKTPLPLLRLGGRIAVRFMS